MCLCQMCCLHQLRTGSCETMGTLYMQTKMNICSSIRCVLPIFQTKMHEAISSLLWMQVIGESTLLNVLANRVLLLLFSICSCKKQNVGDPVPLFSGRSDKI
jgi:hypothetical protein